MNEKVKILLAFSLIFLNACSLNVTGDHNKAVNSGYEKLPIPKSLRDKFGAVSCITHYNLPTRGYSINEKDWHTVTIINGRYELNYVQKIKLSLLKTKVIESIGDGTLYINELKSIFLQNGSVSGRYGGLQKVITGGDLKKLFESNWDFTVLGYELNNESVKNIEWNIKWWNDSYPLQNSKILLPSKNSQR